MIVYVFGNSDLEFDSLPLRILPQLRGLFPDVTFEIKDPNEDWDVPEDLVVLDTAFGINEVMVFDDLDKFEKVPRVSMHDFDAITNLRYLKKIGKIKKIKIIGVPPGMDEKMAAEEVGNKLKEICK
ncbi:MAG: hypothetical protein WCP15_03900 [bacterium]